MKKALFLGAAALMIGTTANAASGTFTDGDNSPDMVSWSSTTAANNFEDAAPQISAEFTLKGTVTKTCSMQGVDDTTPGLQGTVDLGTIGINAGDDSAVSELFVMAGPASVQIKSAAAGCNYNNTVSLTKDSVQGLVNTAPGNYDSAQFQANIPYALDASFTGVVSGQGSGSLQHVLVSTTQASNVQSFGAWRSPFQLDVSIPVVAGKGLVGGTYQSVVTVTLAIS